MPFKPNQVVSINFQVKDQDGNKVDESKQDQPYSFISGQNQILPKLEEKLSEMVIGSKKTVELDPQEAYGEYKDEAVQSVNKNDFPQDTKVEEGMGFVANTEEGKQLPFYVQKVEGEDVTIDFNHPLAGKSLNFEVELVDVRDATQEELSHGHVHGPGGHQH